MKGYINFKELRRNFKENKYCRAISYPYSELRYSALRKKYYASGYPEQLEKIKKIHSGERCFIIGNGPSLCSQDLNMIEKEYTFGTNKIYNIYGDTVWRPTYYVCEDKLSFDEEIYKWIEKVGAKKIFLNWAVHDTVGERENVLYCNMSPYFVVNIWDYKGVSISEDCSKEFGWASTVTFTAIQLAIYMGFSEIYLLGIDFNYPYYKDARGKKHYTGEEKSHFNGGEYQWVNYMVKETNGRGYKIAKEYCDEHGVVIRNATRGGKLEIFERVKLESILS